jgi:hypothetical protein
MADNQVRHLILVDQAVTLLPPSPVVDTVKQWIKTQLEWMQSSPQGAEARSARNNVEVWYHALVSLSTVIAADKEHASHLATFDSDQAAIYATEQLNWYLSLPPPALMAKELSRSRPRHYVLFTLEPLFLLTRIAAGTGPLKPVYAGNLGISLDFARDVPPGVIEYESDSDPRYGAQLAWFERILARWTASAVPDGGPDGSHWDGGWNQAARLAWAMI